MDWVDFIYNCVLWIFWLYILPMVIVIIWNKITGDKWKTDNPYFNMWCNYICYYNDNI